MSTIKLRWSKVFVFIVISFIVVGTFSLFAPKVLAASQTTNNTTRNTHHESVFTELLHPWHDGQYTAGDFIIYEARSQAR